MPKVVNDAKKSYILIKVSPSEKERFEKLSRRLNDGEENTLSRTIRQLLRKKYRETFPEEFEQSGD